ncbi:acyltransferase family protein [Bacillus massiliigorillae]|uniref:acyltransferase family protein n=1 Tax=Bacillus massiliigorillae TaxID=1243664 RepID=UPI0003A52CF6|nr:acyltransferase family protein [Bacillus massiliigorillae]
MSKGRNRYIPGLDGLRALAVLAVIAYHLNFNWASGGLLGVTIFFVLSGYLITNLLLIEWEQTRRIDLKNFWIRRARRLLPGMLTMVLIITAWITLFDQAFLAKLQDDFWAAILYVSNWWYIFHDLSYFESMGVPSVLTHFWSLAIEEQFYIIWPLFIFLALSIKLKRKPLLILIILMATISALAMGFMYKPGVDPSRVYYGTDTRAFSLLIGAILAFVWPSHKLSARIPKKLRLSMDLIGIVSFISLLIMIYSSNQYSGFLYLGGMVLASIITAILIASIVHPSSTINKVLGVKPLRWIGVRSYGIYLWHYPIILLTNPLVNTEKPSLLHIAFQIALTFVIAELSYKYIENPIRRGCIKQFIKKVKSGNWKLKQLSTSRWVALGCGLIIVFISTIGLAATPTDQASEEKANSTRPLEIVTDNNKQEQTDASVKYNKEIKEQPKGNAKEDSELQKVPQHETNQVINVIGDSVVLDVAPFLQEKFQNINIDAKVGRQMSKAEEVYHQFEQNGKAGDTIIIGLGSNGAFSSSQLHSLLSAIGTEKKIILINTRVPRPWESVVNNALKEAATNNQNVTLVDWYSHSAGHNEYFAPDGVHLTKTGSQAYASLIEQTINN